MRAGKPYLEGRSGGENFPSKVQSEGGTRRALDPVQALYEISGGESVLKKRKERVRKGEVLQRMAAGKIVQTEASDLLIAKKPRTGWGPDLWEGEGGEESHHEGKKTTNDEA